MNRVGLQPEDCRWFMESETGPDGVFNFLEDASENSNCEMGIVDTPCNSPNHKLLLKPL